MVSGQRTAMVRNSVQGLRARPDAGAPILWRAEPGVVGVLSDCASSWCKFTVDGRGGYVRSEGIWGVSANETLDRSEEHTSELQSLMRISYAVFCLKKKI